jgi:hypothetical protein
LANFAAMLSSKFNIAFLALIALPILAAGQDRASVRWDVSMYGIGASEKSLPFWEVTNRNGLYPETRGGLMVGSTDLEYSFGDGWSLYGGTTLAASLSQHTDVFNSPAVESYGSSAVSHDAFDGKVGQLYAGIGWKALRLDLGMRNRQRWFEESTGDFRGCCSAGHDLRNLAELSLTGGDMMWTGNARNVPGYNIHSEYIDVPFTKGIVTFKFNYADYIFIDDRYVDAARLHNKSVYLRFRLSDRVDLQAGLEHFAVWGGDSPVYGSQPHSFKDYVKVVFGRSGGSDATASDQENVLGDHRGRELFQLNWRADKFTFLAAHDRPFEDGSGVRFKNFPDGVTTIGISLNDRDKWVTDVLYEYVFTRSQSGSVHRRAARPDELAKNPDKLWKYPGGRDNYFNNSEYASGWTNYGRTIGLALLTPMPVNADGLVLGVANNRIRAHHLAIAGKAAHKIPYRIKATYSINYGNYTQREEIFESSPKQFSGAIEADLPQIGRTLPLLISIGTYVDLGELYPDNLGLTLRLTLRGSN